MGGASNDKGGTPAQSIRLPADCRVAGVAVLHAVLLDAAAQPVSLLDGDGVERVDTAALQLLAAFQREAGACGHEIRWTGVSDALCEAAELLGLARWLNLPAARPA